MRLATAPIVLVCVLGCNTVPKEQIQAIDVPPGLSSQQVEFAILATLADNPPPDDLSPELDITDRALKAWFGWSYQSARENRGDWFLEARTPGRITAGIQRGRYYLRVGIIHGADQVSFHVENSRNLRESNIRIHKTAVRWIQDLEIEIRRSLGQLAVR